MKPKFKVGDLVKMKWGDPEYKIGVVVECIISNDFDQPCYLVSTKEQIWDCAESELQKI